MPRSLEQLLQDISLSALNRLTVRHLDLDIDEFAVLADKLEDSNHKVDVLDFEFVILNELSNRAFNLALRIIKQAEPVELILKDTGFTSLRWIRCTRLIHALDDLQIKTLNLSDNDFEHLDQESFKEWCRFLKQSYTINNLHISSTNVFTLSIEQQGVFWHHIAGQKSIENIYVLDLNTTLIAKDEMLDAIAQNHQLKFIGMYNEEHLIDVTEEIEEYTYRNLMLQEWILLKIKELDFARANPNIDDPKRKDWLVFDWCAHLLVYKYYKFLFQKSIQHLIESLQSMYVKHFPSFSLTIIHHRVKDYMQNILCKTEIARVLVGYMVDNLDKLEFTNSIKHPLLVRPHVSP